MWRDPRKGLQKKRRLERELIHSEIFCEAIPTFLVVNYLLIIALRHTEDKSILLVINPYDESSFTLFIVAYTTSALSAILGMAKTMKVGPCRILKAQTGLLSPSFLLIFLSCISTWAPKVLTFALPLLKKKNVKEMA